MAATLVSRLFPFLNQFGSLPQLMHRATIATFIASVCGGRDGLVRKPKEEYNIMVGVEQHIQCSLRLF